MLCDRTLSTWWHVSWSVWLQKRRFQCTCPPGYTGHRCKVVLPPRSCKDVMIGKQVKTNGIYNITDQQSTATLIPSLVLHGLWSSLTPFETMTPSRAKPSSITTWQSTKMHLNGTATACQCPVWSPSVMFPLTGEPLVTSWLMALTTEITFARHLTKMTCLMYLVQIDVLGTSLLTSEETGAWIVLHIPLTVTNTVITSIVGIAQILAVTSTGNLTEELKAKTTSMSTVR